MALLSVCLIHTPFLRALSKVAYRVLSRFGLFCTDYSNIIYKRMTPVLPFCSVLLTMGLIVKADFEKETLNC